MNIMIKNTSNNNIHAISPSSASDCAVVENCAVKNARHPTGKKKCAPQPSATLGHLKADGRGDLQPLGKWQCFGLDQANNRYTGADRPRWGGKGMYLMVLTDVGLKVPPFRCIAAEVWQRLENVPLDLSPLLSAMEDGHEFGQDRGTLAMVRNWIGAADHQKQHRWLEAMSSFVASDDCYQQLRRQPAVAAIAQARQALTAVPGFGDVALIVRSSGIGEDSLGNAQAGKYDSMVHGGGDILKTYLKVIASSYRPEAFVAGAQPMAVIVQHCISCRFSGVAMSYRRCDDNTLVVEYGPGQGRGVVSGQYAITPHRYEISRGEGQTVFSPGNAAHGFFLQRNEDGRYSEELAAVHHDSAELDDVQLEALRQGVELLENRLLCPVDVEFAIDQQGKLWFLQVRPVTSLPGGSSFSTASPVNILDQGVAVSDGSGSGMALSASGDETPLPEHCVLFADHGQDWMLRADVLVRLRGVVFKRGGHNDHIAITLRQAGLPYMLVSEPQWWPGDAPEPVTLVCGQFQKTDGGFLLAGDLQRELLNSGAGPSPDYQAAMACTAAWQEPVTAKNLDRVDHLFQWLVQSNERLLDFMGPQRLMHLCLSNRGAVQLSMHPRRAEIIDHCAREVRYFLTEAEAFLAGYRQLFTLGTASDNPEYAKCQDELAPLGEQLAEVRHWVEISLARFTRPFRGNAELPRQDSNLQHWLHSCQQLSSHLLRQVRVRLCQEINSIHQLVLWLHQRFLTMIAPVASASGQGLVHTGLPGAVNEIRFVDFAPAPSQQLLDRTGYNALMMMDAERITVLNMPDYVQMAIKLQCHACSVELLRQAEGGRERTLRLRYGEDFCRASHVKGKWLRLWFLVQTLAQSSPTAGAPDIVYNDQSHQMLFEFTRIPSADAMQKLFVDILALLHSLKDLDLSFDKIHLDSSQTVWSMSAIQQRLTNPTFAKANRHGLAHAYWLVGCEDSGSLITPWTQGKELAHLEVTARIFKKASDDRVNQLLEAQSDSHRRTVLWHFLLTDPTRASRWVQKWTSWLRDKATAIRLVSQNGHILKFLTPRLRNERAVVWAAVKCDPQALAYAPDHFKNDVGIVSRALRSCENGAKVFRYIGPQLINDPVIFRQLATLAVTCDFYVISYFAKVLKLDQPFLKELLLLGYKAVDHRQIDDWVVDKNVLQDHQLYRQMAIDHLKTSRNLVSLGTFPDLLDDREVVEASISSHPNNLACASLRLRGDRALVRHAVAQYGGALSFASPALCDDFELVLIAVKNRGSALRFASGRLRSNPLIVTAAIQNDCTALTYAPESIRRDPHFARLAVSHQNPKIVISHYLCHSFYSDKALMMVALERNHGSFRSVSDALRDDDELVRSVLKYHGEQLEHASARLRDDHDLVCLAVASVGWALKYASERLRADRDVVELALRNNGMALRWAKQPETCAQLVAIAVQQNGLALRFAPDSLRSDKSLVTSALHNNGEALRFVDLSLWDDPDIIAAAVDSIGPVAVENIRLNIFAGAPGI